MYLIKLGDIVDDLIVDVAGVVASADVVGVVISANELVVGIGGRQLSH